MGKTEFVSTPLFGSAIVAELPENFADVRQAIYLPALPPNNDGKLRQVPDNQEVYIDKDGFTSIIFEICERVGPSGTTAEIDGKALSTHLEELVGDDADSVRVWNTTDTQFSELPESIPAYSLIATQTPRPEPKAAASSAPDFTAIILTLLRLEKESTDILITINVPHIKGEYDEEDVDLQLGKQGQLIGDAVEYASRIWATFQVKDWNLFNEV